RRRIARRSAVAPRVIAVDPVELGGGIAAEIFLGIRRLFRVLAQVAFPLPAAPLAAGALQLALHLAQITLGRFHGSCSPAAGRSPRSGDRARRQDPEHTASGRVRIPEYDDPRDIRGSAGPPTSAFAGRRAFWHYRRFGL